MAIKINPSGAERILKYLVGEITTTELLYLRLYANNITPTNITSLSDFIEVTGGSYVQKTLSAEDWDVQGNVATSTIQSWTFNAGIGNIYGYYLVGQTTGTLYASEKFVSGPFNIVNAGDSVSVTATISIGT